MTQLDKRLDEILNSLVNQVEWCVNPSAGAISVNREKEQTAQKQAKQAIKQLMADEFEKMIGDIEYRETSDMGLSSWTTDDIKAFGRNELKIELRQKLEEFRK